MRPFIIGFDAKRAFCNFTGLGNYSRSLIMSLKTAGPGQRIVLFTPRAFRCNETAPFFTGDFEIVVPESKLLWRSLFIKNDLRRTGVTLYHGLSHELPLFSKPLSMKYVVTIHDVIYAHFPRDFTPIDRSIYAFKTGSACAKADRIIAVSESTKNDLVRLFNTSPDKIDVVYQSCHDRFKTRLAPDSRLSILTKYGLDGPYLLYVGSIIERKNLLSLVKAVELLPEGSTPLLAVVGKGKRYKAEVMRYIASRHLDKRVRFMPAVDAADLPALYQGATFLAYPSVYEGFGLPIIEALYSGIPVITSRSSSLPEAAGPGALYADPASPDDLAEKMKVMLDNEDLRRKLASEGFAHVQQFNNDAVTEALLATYQKTLG
jgi:glycosyltransferase involved in cell wall biosynthesis